MSDKYVGETYSFFHQIPDEVIEDDSLAVVSEGVDEGFKVITAEEYNCSYQE